ncbi:Mrp/NBP35 family ATP-binding protein [Methanogenium organophilum]|uniref:Iron-sulfur cluster carrier protein n=1 Tax=Methanogenium organophilum TaxID=2199 RepID=A0A9X9S3G8_METOG|nr:Mrp/NBP35 family ATP-binding protein [Methanogenium organophilum]WAI00230.1 Mrp/NBP35 family ATP-binding protein [Methanogenium organophilum]
MAEERQAHPPPNMPERANISVRHVVLILSGKGGVGKTTVAANLAFAFANHGFRTGLLDLDIHGPDIPKILGIEGSRMDSYDTKLMEPVSVTGNLAVVSMAFLLPETSSPVIWRGPMKTGAIRQFLEGVHWGELDYLVVDLPPGTGDEALTIAQFAPNIAGAVIVTTPQDMAILDIKKAVRFVQTIGLPVIGIIENMSGMVCPHCGKEIDIFGKGGGKQAAEEMGVPFLGAVPLDPEMRKAADEGRPFLIRSPGMARDNPTWKQVDAVMEKLVRIVEEGGEIDARKEKMPLNPM